VAFADTGQPIGTVSLKHNDLESRPDITPCLGGMFVVPEWRRRLVASLLVRRVLDEARRLGYETVYLWTDSAAAEALYLKLGWKVLERMDYAGKPSLTMVRSGL
jgi:predicted N-acetyltransferase YhbS